MSARILDGKVVASRILSRITQEISQLQGDKPRLAVILVGDNPSSQAYIRMKEKRAQEVGMDFILHHYKSTITQEELEREVRMISVDTSIHGLIIQAPLPAHIDRYAVTECIAPEKDVDGFTRTQIGNMYLGHTGLWSCTPKGIMTLLDQYDIPVRGKKIAVIGRSNIIGKPMALMLINAGATVTSCNSQTQDLREITRSSDIVIIAIGTPYFLTSDMVGPDTVVIDVGSNYYDGKFCGDVDFGSVKDHVAAISPSPGGVGPMTVATLIENTWLAYQDQKKLK